MDEPANPIREEHVDLLRLDHRRHFAQAEGRVHHGLPFAIRARPVIRRAVLWQRALILHALAGLECAARAALRAAHSRNLTLFVEQRDHMSTLLFTDRT